MWDSTRQETGYSEVLDYYMSEKFGLDWRDYDQERMRTFIHIIGLKNERARRDAEREKNKQKK